MSNNVNWVHRVVTTGAAMAAFAIPVSFGIMRSSEPDGGMPNRNRAPWLKKPTASHIEAAESQNLVGNIGR